MFFNVWDGIAARKPTYWSFPHLIVTISEPDKRIEDIGLLNFHPSICETDMNTPRPTNSLQKIPERLVQQSPLGWAAALLAIVAMTSSGCSDSNTTTEFVTQPKMLAAEVSPTDSPISSPVTTRPIDQLPAAVQQEEASGLIGKAGKLLNGAKQVTGQQAAETGQWLKGAWDGASNSTGSAVDGSLDWANETYKSLKDQGLTTASSTGEWLSEDWNNMESFRYKVLATSSVPAEDLEDKLNELGKQGWECFSVDDQRMIFKKAPESYLRRLPFKDILRLAPLLNQMKQ